MTTPFIFARVSTTEQDTTAQVADILARIKVAPDRILTEKVSGMVPALDRPGFRSLVETMRKVSDAELWVARVDRLGRDSIDILTTVRHLQGLGIGVRCLDLGDGVDLGSPTGQLLLGVLSAVASMERALNVERTMSGLAQARAEGRIGGRKAKLTPEQVGDVKRRHSEGESMGDLSKAFGDVGKTIIHRAIHSQA